MRALAHAWDGTCGDRTARPALGPYPLAAEKCSPAFVQLTTFHQASM
jgi:hypothetical protein